MANGYYLFNSTNVNRSNQSAVAMSAYRSDETLYSERDGLTKKYKSHAVKPESFILKPSHAPDWTLNREKLWNEVEKYENRENARIARSVLLGLPNDFSHEQQLELTKEYVQENFVDEGMVADVSIHRDEENNPHAHILLTVRGFNENGEWEKRKSKRVPSLDQEGNFVLSEKGWKVTKSVKLNNWDKKEKLIEWRANWSEKLNEKSKDFGKEKTYSHESYEKQGKDIKPTIRMTREEYQYEEKVKEQHQKEGTAYEPTTFYAKKNVEIKKYNEKFANVVHLEEYRTDKNLVQKIDKFTKQNVTNIESMKATKLLVNRVKGYVDFGVAQKLYNEFSDPRNKWNLKLEKEKSYLASERKVYGDLIDKFNEKPSYVEQFGYSQEGFKEEVKKDILNMKERETKFKAEFEKFDELKMASSISLKHQQDLLNTEFSIVHNAKYLNDFSYEEKHFAMDLLRKHNIILPKELIKEEFTLREKEYDNTANQIPVWKQAKDTLTSIGIYERSIKRINRSRPEDLKDLKTEVVKLHTFKELKTNYEKYINDIEPIINQQISEIGLKNKQLDTLDIQAKVAVLEEHSKLSETEKEQLNIKQFISTVQEKFEEQAEQANEKKMQSDGNEKDIYQSIANNSQNISDGLFSVLNQLQHANDLSDSAEKGKGKKPFRRRTSDGREL
ncbi:MobA/MobL family protein [Planococcus sp. S3-L1]|uniref:MobA/MobL family protein n=1 Tax=Planococcus sp. S3-L1 TaxID=3046200 RepID=UPI0024BAC7CB|nr:MobA/MobL family protein [Planococcus sp. S3-L1]MDJ0333284.1 MobA/MobL family protein [Planococcus sp. S3-L1]